MTNDTVETTTLIFKNIPRQIDDLTNLLNSLKIPAQQIKPFGRKRALITYEHKTKAQQALETLQELEFSGKPINIAIFCPDKPKENKDEKSKPIVKKVHKSIQTALKEAGATTQLDSAVSPQEINKYVQKLYAIEGDLGFEQPPPPYLKYRYPAINKDILDNICIALLSNKRFYTQVLHLMNRMNLEPPFVKRNYKFTPPGEPKEASTQTEKIETEEPTEDIESELESSEDDELKAKQQISIKRKLPPQDEQYKKKARKIIQTMQKLNKEIETKRSSNTSLSVNEIFDNTEKPTTSSAINKIELHLKRPTNAKEVNIPENIKSNLNLPLDLQTQKMPPNELQQLNIFKNYQKGAPSNKLYIKNLHKDVSVEDLRLLYQRFIKDNSIELDIKVMQHGRMKGQAFVTFQSERWNLVQSIIEQALEDTNGFILRDKPMVVCYGKQS